MSQELQLEKYNRRISQVPSKVSMTERSSQPYIWHKNGPATAWLLFPNPFHLGFYPGKVLGQAMVGGQCWGQGGRRKGTIPRFSSAEETGCDIKWKDWLCQGLNILVSELQLCLQLKVTVGPKSAWRCHGYWQVFLRASRHLVEANINHPWRKAFLYKPL